MSALGSISSTFSPQPQPSNPPPDQQSNPPSSDTSEPSSNSAQGAQGSQGSQANASSDTQTTSSDQAAKPAEAQPVTPANSTPSATAETKLAATAETLAPLSDAKSAAPRIENDDAQALAAARESAESYRSAAAKDQYLQGLADLARTTDDGKTMDIKVPLIDELPDRPAPAITPGVR